MLITFSDKYCTESLGEEMPWFFLSSSAPSVTHPPLSSTFGGFSRGAEVVERAPLLHGAPPIVHPHVNLSPHVRSQVGLRYPASHHSIQTLAEKAFF